MKVIKRFACAILTVGVLCSSVTAFAAMPGNADIWSLGDIYVNGREAWGWTDKNEIAYHLSYKGSVYVQLRAVAEWMGKDVTWDESTKTITLSGSKEPFFRGNAKIENADLSDEEREAIHDNGVPVTERSDITVMIDGVPLEMKDAKGNRIYPIVYNNTNYLPVRTVSEMLGMSVTFCAKPEAIYLRTPLTAEEDAACKTYLQTLQAQLAIMEPYRNAHGSSMEALLADQKTKIEINDMATLKTAVDTCYNAIKTIKDTPKPDVKLVDVYYERLQERLNDFMPSLEKIKSTVDSGADFETCKNAYLGSQASAGMQTIIGAAVGHVYPLECVILEGK